MYFIAYRHSHKSCLDFFPSEITCHLTDPRCISKKQNIWIEGPNYLDRGTTDWSKMNSVLCIPQHVDKCSDSLITSIMVDLE